jgi:hypothetical protein|tara:strand:+ start:1118 stop:1321 length:204 start_codon:yes stop_codon:yes gene_type:complete
MAQKNKTYKNKIQKKKGGNKIKNKKTKIHRKTQKGGWGGFIYGIATGAALYKWFSYRPNNEKNNDQK